jgi:hypothetical protein
MSKNNYGLALAAKEHLVSGLPLTRLEALIFFGLSNLTDLISEMRKQGWIIKSRKITMAAAVVRINQNAVLKPPSNLPQREILCTEYWIEL